MSWPNNTENQTNKAPNNYAQAAISGQRRDHNTASQHHQGDLDNKATNLTNSGSSADKISSHSSYTHNHKNSYNKKYNNNRYNNHNNNMQSGYNNGSYKKTPSELGNPQFRPTNNQPTSTNTSLPNTAATTRASTSATATATTNAITAGRMNATPASEAPSSSIPVTDNTLSSYRPPNRASQQQQRQQNPDITKSPRATNDGRLFTQPYVPRRDHNKGDYGNRNVNNGYDNNNNTYNGDLYYVDSRNGYGRPPLHQPRQQSYPYQPYQSPSYAFQQPLQHPSHFSAPQYSPQQHHLSPMPVDQASPNMNNYNPKDNIPHSSSSPQASPMNTIHSRSPGSQYYHQYMMPVHAYSPQATTQNAPAQTTTRKGIRIVNPDTGSTYVPNGMDLSPSPSSVKEEKLDLKSPLPNTPKVSRAITIVDPAIRDRELREKKEREEAEKEAIRKAEEEKVEAEKRAQEEKERQEREEREEKERLERLEQEVKERVERELKERLDREEKERLEREVKERLERLEHLEREEKERKEKDLALKIAAEEEAELKRIKAELEAKKRREVQDRIIAAGMDFSSVGIHNALAQPPMSTKTQKSPLKVIENLGSVNYPAGTLTPSSNNEKWSKDEDKFTYSIEFLLQFQQLCLDTDVDLSNVMNEIGVIADDSDSNGMLRSNSNMRQNSDNARGIRPPSVASGYNTMPGDTMFRASSRDGRMEMGKFNMGRPLTTRAGSTTHMDQMNRTGSNGGSSIRGGRGGMSGMNISRSNTQQSSHQGAPTIPMEEVAPLEKSENRWKPSSAALGQQDTKENDLLSQEVVYKKVTLLLNKVTLEKFDSLSKQIFEYAKQSEKEDDGSSLRTVLKVTFETACDNPHLAVVWARLCRFMYDSMTDKIRDINQRDIHGNIRSGTSLFRCYLFKRCEVEFRKGWTASSHETMLSDEYYMAEKIKRRGLGLIQFIGEQFKLGLMSLEIINECINKLCSSNQEEDVKSLCKLMTTIGKVLDKDDDTRVLLNKGMEGLKNALTNTALPGFVTSEAQTTIELRANKWVPKQSNAQTGPTTIAEIHEQAEKEAEIANASASAKRNNNTSGGQYIPNQQHNKNSNYNNNNMARSGSSRSNKDPHHFQSHNNNHANSDGWNVVSGGGHSNNRNRVNNDFNNFGKIDKNRTKHNMLGPGSSPFLSLNRGTSDNEKKVNPANDNRSNNGMNMFSALEKPDERRKLLLKPRTAVDGYKNNMTEPNEKDKNHSTESESLPEDAIKVRCKNILEEYFNILDKKELCECIKELNPHSRTLFVSEMLKAVEKKAQDVKNMADTIEYLEREKMIERELYVNAWKKFMEGYDDLTIDVPQAPKFTAQLLLASKLTPSEVNGGDYASLQRAFTAAKSEKD